MEKQNTGLLLNPTNLKIQRNYFNQMVKLLGVQVKYRAPKEDKHYNGYGELESFYYEPQEVGCIFEEHVNQWTLKKLGWAAELQEDVALISVPYDLQKLQVGALFSIPSAIEGAEDRLFRVLRMSTSMIYPSSVTCEIAPIYQNTTEASTIQDFTQSDFNLLVEEED